jgi:hypothetical protein
MGNLNVNIPTALLKKLKIGAIEKDEKLASFVISLLEKGLTEKIEPAEPLRDLDGLPAIEHVTPGEFDAYVTMGYYSQEQADAERQRRGIDFVHVPGVPDAGPAAE